MRSPPVSSLAQVPRARRRCGLPAISKRGARRLLLRTEPSDLSVRRVRSDSDRYLAADLGWFRRSRVGGVAARMEFFPACSWDHAWSTLHGGGDDDDDSL